jgi:AsmA protein
MLGLLLVLAAVLTWLVMGFDANRYKGVAIEWMQAHHNRTLTINGPIGLSLFPRLQITLAHVALSEAGRPDEFAALEHAELAVDVLPLLNRELVIGRVAARGLRANYLKNALGVRNIDDLLNPETASDNVSSGSKKPPRLDINSIDLENLRLHVKDEVAGIAGDLMIKSVTAGRLRNQTEAPVELALQVDLQTPAVQGELSGETQLTLDLDSGSVQARDLNLAFKGTAMGVSAIRASIKGSAGWDGATSAIDAKALRLDVAATSGGLVIDSSSLSLASFAYNPAAKDIGLTQLKFEMKGRQDAQALSFALDWPELAATGDQLKGSAFSGRLQRGGAAPLSVDFKSAAPTGSFDTLRLPGVEANFASSGAQRKLGGTLKANLVLKQAQAAGAGKNAAATPASVALDALTLQALIENPGLQPLKVNARGTASASAQRAGWTLAGDINGGAFNTDGQALLGAAVPKVSAKARFDALDLNRLLADAPAAAAAAPTKPSAGQPAAPAADTPVDLSALRSIDGQFSLQAATFAFQRYKVAAARIDATLDHGLLRVPTLQGKVWGGSVDASALADASTGRVGIKGAANGIDINSALKDVAAKDWMDGTGRVTMDVEATGRSINELKSRLQGQLALQLRDGAIKGINLAKSLRQAKAALGGQQDTVQKANETEKTDFSELSASFQIANGVARSKDLDVKSPFLRLGGEGAVDIGKGRIDYLARATVTGTSKGQDGADLAALKGLQVPVRLSGPFDALDWKIEWSSVIAGAVTQQLKNEARNRLEEQLGLKPAEPGASAPATKPKDALKGLLKGLLK